MINLNTPSNGSFTGYSIQFEDITPVVEPVSLAEAKLYCRIDGTEEDALITSLVKMARQKCESYIGKCIIRKTVTITSFSFPYQFQIPYAPIEAVSDVLKVATIDTEGNERSLNYLINIGLYPKLRIIDNHYSEQFIVQYKAGFTNVPEDINLAIKMLVNTMYERREDFSDLNAIEQPIGVKALLQPYITYNWFGA